VQNVLLRSISVLTLTGALLLGAGTPPALAQATDAVLAPGYPPLTRSISDSSAELTVFMLKVVASGDARTADLTLDSSLLNGWADSLASGYADLSADEQQNLAMMPSVRSGLQAVWPAATASDKADVRDTWRPIVQEWLAQMDCDSFTTLADGGLVEPSGSNRARYSDCGDDEDDDEIVAPADTPTATAAAPAPSTSAANQHPAPNDAWSHAASMNLSNSLLQSHMARMSVIQSRRW
jgi:hypothetical protein